MCVRRFIEKPNAATAQSYLDAGGLLLERGHVRAQGIGLAQGNSRIPARHRQRHLRRVAQQNARPHFRAPRQSPFAAIPADSIDYAVMERCPGSYLGEDDMKAVLKQCASQHGWSMEKEVRQILRCAVNEEPTLSAQLGSRIASRFTDVGLTEPLPALRGHPLVPMSFHA